MPESKQALRERLLARRRERDEAARSAVEQAVAHHLLALPAMAGARQVAAYLSMPTEVGTAALLSGLADRGVDVIVPVTPADGPLDWVRLEPGAPTERSGLGVEEPRGTRLGPDAVLDCDVVVVPALAVDHAGHRLGRGAGWYDRTLAHADLLTVALVHADELLSTVPHEPHDVPVRMAVTETGTFRVP